jgi:type IV pilus assembly protein PilN
MSVRINLLPHREERRKRQRQHFTFTAGLSLALGVAICGMVYLTIDQMISTQQSRNEFIKRQNEKLEKEIAEIRKLQEDIRALLARKQVIETLQADRSRSVLLLEQLVRQTPDGVYLRAIKQAGLRVNVLGFAQSNARVSTFMRNIQASAVLDNPTLVEIKASDFNLNFSLRPQIVEADSNGKPRAKPPAAKSAAGAMLDRAGARLDRAANGA